jgi:hypothetical protein
MPGNWRVSDLSLPLVNPIIHPRMTIMDCIGKNKNKK